MDSRTRPSPAAVTFFRKTRAKGWRASSSTSLRAPFRTPAAGAEDIMTTETIRYELRDTIALITMDDGKANAISPAGIATLHAHLDRAEREAAAVLLTGRERRLS